MNQPSDAQPDFSEMPDTTPLVQQSYLDLNAALARAISGIATRIHHLDQDVTFLLDNHQEVRLRVKTVEIMHEKGEVKNFKVNCRTNFENVLILAQKINMRIAAFSTFFSVTLRGEPDFVTQWNDEILNMEKPADFFETLDELKRPIFLNLNHYIFSRITK